MTWKGIRLFAKSFNPRTPCGVRRFRCWWRGQAVRFQSTHSLRSATKLKPLKKGNNYVSIHALLAECDFSGFVIQHQGYCFNPRTPCGVRRSGRPKYTDSGAFQSTHSLRSATRNGPYTCYYWQFQSTHSLRSATRKATYPRCHESFQSTHSLRSATCHGGVVNLAYRGFNPRTPCGVRQC